MFRRRDFLKGSILGGLTLNLSWKSQETSENEGVYLVEDVDSEPVIQSVYSTGIQDLDEMLKGGLRRGLYLIPGPAGSGKTHLLHTIAQANPRSHTWLRPWPLKSGVKIGDPDHLARFAKDYGRSIILVDCLIPNEFKPTGFDKVDEAVQGYRKGEVLSIIAASGVGRSIYSSPAYNLCRLAMDHNMVVVAAVRTQKDVWEGRPEMWEAIRFANGVWSIDGERLFVLKERYGTGRYSSNQGLHPLGSKLDEGLMKFTDVLNKKKYSVMVALRFDEGAQKSGVYSISREDLESMEERNPSYFETVSLPSLCARLDKMGADSCTDAIHMVKQIVKGRQPICELDAMFI